MGRHRQEEERQEPLATARCRSHMRERLSATGDDDINDEQGQPVVHVDGTAARRCHTLRFADLDGRAVDAIQRRLVHLRETTATCSSPRPLAVVPREAVAPRRITRRWTWRPALHCGGREAFVPPA